MLDRYLLHKILKIENVVHFVKIAFFLNNYKYKKSLLKVLF